MPKRKPQTDGLPDCDRRLKPYRKWLALYKEFSSKAPIFGGKKDKRFTRDARLAATTVLKLEQLELDIIEGRAVNGEELVRIQRQLDRYLSALGLLTPQEQAEHEKSPEKVLEKIRTWEASQENLS